MRRLANIGLGMLLLMMLAQVAPASSFDDLLGFLARHDLSLPDGASADAVAVDAVLRQIDSGYAFIEEGASTASSPSTGTVARLPLAMWTERLGYVLPGRFDQAGLALLDASLDAIEFGHIDGLIIDLRGCSVGTLEDAIPIASRFVPSGTDLASQTRRRARPASSQTRIWRAGGPAHDGVDFRCALLTDSMTTGGAEALAALLQPFAPFLIVGQPTAGRLAVREQLPYGKGVFLSIATSELTIGDRDYRAGDPVRPDLLVDGSAGYGGTKAGERETLERDLSAKALDDRGLMAHVGDDATLGKAIDILLAMRAISSRVAWSRPATGKPATDGAVVGTEQPTPRVAPRDIPLPAAAVRESP